jgi:hypothetical protein
MSAGTVMSHAASLNAAPRRRRVATLVTVVIIGALGALLVWRGLSFYRLDAHARVDHPDYATLKSSGLLGHGYGMVGTGLILTNLLYLVRRRFMKYLPAWIGSVKLWLDMHVVTGLGGSLLILFHSAFQLRTPIATVTSVSLAIVVVTGLVGLYLHELLPRAGLAPLKDRLADVEAVLPGLAKRVAECVEKVPCTKLPPDASFLRTLFTLPRWTLEARRRRREVKAAARGDKLFRALALKDARLAADLAAELGELAAAEIDTLAGSSLMRTWRSLHHFLALLMIVSVTVHIAVAWVYGFRWIFSQ